MSDSPFAVSRFAQLKIVDVAGLAAIDEHVAGPAQVPAEEREPAERRPWR